MCIDTSLSGSNGDDLGLVISLTCCTIASTHASAHALYKVFLAAVEDVGDFV